MVTADGEEAQAALERGERVVLIVPGGTGCGAPSAVPGRLALFVGDPADPAVWDAASAMAVELFV